ncbi:MAG: hypothetical protein U0Q55_01885 [Vicinamibacterales bacterium]
MRILFRVAAGPSIGFGHLMRARALARALDVPPTVSIRGMAEAAAVASQRGFTVVPDGLSGLAGPASPDVLVIDDPLETEGARWVRRGREAGIPVVTLHDLGLGYHESDLAIDGSIDPGDHRQDVTWAGPMFAVLDPQVAVVREHPVATREGVLIALGGGEHVHRWGEALARAVLLRCPDARIRLVQGFAREAGPAGDARITWIQAPDGLADELNRTAVAVLAGGLTLYEAAALATPAVALAVVDAQQPTIRGFARRGAAIDAGHAADVAAFAHAADAAAELLSHPGRAARMGATAAHLIDGRGVFRVADAIRQLATRDEDHSHAA